MRRLVLGQTLSWRRRRLIFRLGRTLRVRWRSLFEVSLYSSELVAVPFSKKSTRKSPLYPKTRTPLSYPQKAVVEFFARWRLMVPLRALSLRFRGRNGESMTSFCRQQIVSSEASRIHLWRSPFYLALASVSLFFPVLNHLKY
jgi:hypothetical protein